MTKMIMPAVLCSSANTECSATPSHRSTFEIPESYSFLNGGDKFLALDSGINDENRILVLLRNMA